MYPLRTGCGKCWTAAKSTVTWSWWPVSEHTENWEDLQHARSIQPSHHIRDIKTIYRSAECTFTLKRSQTERVNRQGWVWVFGHANNCWTKAERTVWMILTWRGGWPHRPEEPFWWLTALWSPLCSLITVFKVTVSTASPTRYLTSQKISYFKKKKKKKESKTCQDRNYLPITISNYDVYSPFVLLCAILGFFFLLNSDSLK